MTARGRSTGTPASISEPIKISIAIAVRNASTGLSTAAAAIDHIAQVGRLLTRIPTADAELGYLTPRRSATRPGPRPRRAATPAGSWRAVSRPDRGATQVHRQSVRRTSRPITSAVNKMRIGLSATAAFATNHDCVASAGALCIARSPSAPGRQDIRGRSGSRPGRGPHRCPTRPAYQPSR